MLSRNNSRHVLPVSVYRALYRYFGPQGWWPVTRSGGVYPGYHKLEYSQKSAKEKFEICLGAILTQNTAWKNVEKAISNLNREGAVSCGRILGLKRGKLGILIRPSGYYNQKAGRLKDFARYVSMNYGGDIGRLLGKPSGTLRKELLSLKGIGPETADSIVLYAAGKLSFVIDAYTIRLGQRLGWFGQKVAYEAAREYIVSRLPRSYKVYNEMHALIVALCKDFCRKKPACAACVLKENCIYEKKYY